MISSIGSQSNFIVTALNSQSGSPLVSTALERFSLYHHHHRYNIPVYETKLVSSNHHLVQSTRYSSSDVGLFMSAMEDDDGDSSTEDDAGSPNLDLGHSSTAVAGTRKWNLPALRKEVSRLTVRCHKKIGKANQRLQKAKDEVDRLLANDNVSVEKLEACPNIEELEKELTSTQTRLQQLNQLEVLLQDIKGKKDVVLPDHVAALAVSLEVDDVPPPTQERGARKEKGPRNMASFRRPYRRYYTVNKTEIRVGKQAEDNDELSLSPEHRDSLDWWMQ
jgi:hypothetical protein